LLEAINKMFNSWRVEMLSWWTGIQKLAKYILLRYGYVPFLYLQWLKTPASYSADDTIFNLFIP
jgi:hypothetical protein